MKISTKFNSMPFKKGKSGNPKGKPPGTLSEKTKFWNEVKDWATQEGAQKFIKEMKKLNGKAYTQAYTAFLEYVQPKLNRTELKGEMVNRVTVDIPEEE